MKKMHGGKATETKGKSAPNHYATGSGSRPGGKSKFPIPTSAPADKQGLGRKVPGALK